MALTFTLDEPKEKTPYVPPCAVIVELPNEETLEEEISLFEVIDVSKTFGVTK